MSADVLVLSRPCAVCRRPVVRGQPQQNVMRDGSIVVHAACAVQTPPDGPPSGTPGTPQLDEPRLSETG